MLNEFVSTPSSQLTINEFMSIDLESEADPPCFTESRLKQKQTNMEQIEVEIGHLTDVIDRELENSKCTVATPETAYKVTLDTEVVHDPDIQSASSFINAENPEEVARSLSTKFRYESVPRVHEGLPGPTPTPFSLGLLESTDDLMKIPKKKIEVGMDDDELDLTNIDDEEINKLLLSPNETAIKTRLWMAENGEFMKELEMKAEKKRLEEEEKEKNRPKKTKKKAISKKDYYANSQTAGEAIEKLMKRSKLSSKINYDALKRATNDKPLRSLKPLLLVPKFSDSFSNLAKYDITPKISCDFADETLTVEELQPLAKKALSPCFNLKIDTVNVEAFDAGASLHEPTIESGPIPLVEEEGCDDYYEEDRCLSATQLMQKAGVGDAVYGSYNAYEGFDEYE